MKVDAGKVYLLVLVLLSGLIMGFDLGASSLHNQDEAKHAVVAREAATQGHWLPLTYNGRPYFSKPPLRIWLTALTFKVAGISEWAVRFWSALFGLGTVLALFLIGRRMYGDRMAFLSSLILLTSHQYIYNHCVRTGETDSMLIFFWTCSLLLLQLSVKEKSRRVLYLAAGFLGLCGMVKHLGFVPIVMSIALAYLVLAGAWRAFPWRTWAVAAGIVVGVALPWHLVLWMMKGQAFLYAYFIGEVVNKRLGAGGPGPGGSSPWISLRTLARGFFPWSCFLPFVLLDGAVSAKFRRRWILPTLWLVVTIAATIISSQKFTWYVLPALPAAAILVAGLLDRFLTVSDSLFVRISVVLGCLLAITSVTNVTSHNPFEVMARQSMLSVFFLSRLRRNDSSLFSALGLLLLLTALTLLVNAGLERFGNRKEAPQIARRLLVLAIVGLAIFTVVVPLQFSGTVSPLHKMAQAAEEHLATGETLIVSLSGSKDRNPRFNFYFGTMNIRRISTQELASSRLDGQLLLSDLATMNKVSELPGRAPPPDTYLRRAKGMVLLRWPEN